MLYCYIYFLVSLPLEVMWFSRIAIVILLIVFFWIFVHLYRAEPVLIEFPELKGHSRRDYWLAIIREILYVHQFIRKFQISGVERDEALSKAVLGILRLQAVREIHSTTPVHNEDLLAFNVCDQLPGGDLILETLANLSTSRKLDRRTSSDTAIGMHSISALAMVSNLGFMFGNSVGTSDESRIVVGELAVGEMTALERSVKESKTSYKKVVLAQATIDGVKVDGFDTNLAVMKVGKFTLIFMIFLYLLHSLFHQSSLHNVIIDHKCTLRCIGKFTLSLKMFCRSRSVAYFEMCVRKLPAK